METRIINKETKEVKSIDLSSLIGKSTKSLYLRKGFKNGNYFLSQKGNGCHGAGDVCRIDCEEIEVTANLFNRIQILINK